MKHLHLLVILLLFFISGSAQLKEVETVADRVEQLRKAMIDKNRVALELLTADSLSYGHSGGKTENKSSFVENIASGKSDFLNIEISEQTISIVNRNAIVRHTLLADTNDGGKAAKIRLKILLVWVKEKGEWKLLARQAVKVTG